MTQFPVPNANETRDILGVFTFVNNRASEGLFFPVMLLVIWFVAFIGAIAEGRPASRAWTFSSFITSILGGLLVLLGFLNNSYLFFSVLNVAFGIVWIYLSGSRND